jgi:large subunit ribosomal protein L29|tara:strand:+ start:743 stop:967 length:225 start_codon:yes stop_codon:yes gene_type:complete
MKIQEVRDKTVDELHKELESLKKEFFNIRFQKSTGQLQNTSQIRKVKKSIARVFTILKEKKVTVKVKEKSKDKE